MTTAGHSAYRGRFAPSPTGPLHLGSLLAALASWLEARHAGGCWLLRMEDIDPPREQAGAADAILYCLQQHGLHWDEAVLWQSRRGAAYDSALSELDARGHLFACACSRQQQGPLGECVRGCHQRGCHQRGCGEADWRDTTPPRPHALRVSVPPSFSTRWHDTWQGPQHWPLGATLGNFVVRRKDGLYAYQLAVVVDDAAQAITDVVRGADLLDSTPRQHLLQQLLGHPTPRYAHLPVLTDAGGQKLSKQNLAPAIDPDTPERNLRAALAALGQTPPPATANTANAILAFALAHWTPAAVPAQPAVAGPASF
tara:strand:+ start:17554 stop:18489 length:936 start_codon:yes stop_codon:yes gene_type:complete